MYNNCHCCRYGYTRPSPSWLAGMQGDGRHVVVECIISEHKSLVKQLSALFDDHEVRVIHL